MNVTGLILRGGGGGGALCAEVTNLSLTQQPWSNSQCSQNNSRGKIINIVEVNQLRWLEESGQWLENVG